MISLFKRSKRVQSVEDSLSFLLVEGDSRSKEGVCAILMVPDPTLGGALATVGDAVPLPWSRLNQEGLSAFDAVRSIPPNSNDNTDFHPNHGKFRRRGTVFVEVNSGQVRLAPRRKQGRSLICRKEDEIHLEDSVSGPELVEALRKGLARTK